MLSRSKIGRSISGRFNRLQISVKLMLLYATLMAVLLVVTSSFTVIGLYYTQYHQVEGELEMSLRLTLRQLEDNGHYEVEAPGVSQWRREDMPQTTHRVILHDQIEQDMPLSHHDSQLATATTISPSAPVKQDSLRLEILPGAFLKITDANNQVVFDSDIHAPALAQLQENFRAETPFWANPNYRIVQMGNFMIYYKEEHITLDGQPFTLHLFKTITAETKLLALIQKMLVGEIFFGMLIALILGYFVSQKILHPIRLMTDKARQIEVSNLDARIPVSPAQDELSELAETFNRMLSRVQEGYIQQQHFVSDASHELRTPVTVIKGYADMLLRWGKEDEETLSESLTAISSEAQDMQELIEKLLFLARADQKRQIVNKEKLALEQVVEDVFKKMSMADQNHQLSLLVNQPGEIWGDKVIMKQLLRIFLENAGKYTPQGGSIQLSSEHIPGYMKVVIADSGIGIAPENQIKIFQRFFRIDTSRTKKLGQPGGTGLGLSIARWIADNHDIGISLSSELGKGTKFTLMIPLYQVSVQGESDSPSQA